MRTMHRVSCCARDSVNRKNGDDRETARLVEPCAAGRIQRLPIGARVKKLSGFRIAVFYNQKTKHSVYPYRTDCPGMRRQRMP